MFAPQKSSQAGTNSLVSPVKNENRYFTLGGGDPSKTDNFFRYMCRRGAAEWMDSMFTAIYARQSVEKKDSISIESQIELCKNEAAGEVKVFEDKGFSGKNTKRPAFEKLMKDVEQGNVSKLVCYRLDRVSRSILDFGTIWNTLNKYNVEFVSVNEKFDTSTPVGRAMLYIIMVFAQLERETIAERIKDNYYQRVKKGAWPGGPAPYGMRISGKRVNGVCTLEPTDEINTVKRIFEMYSVSGMSLGKVAKQLTEEGIPCSRRATWDNISVFRILRNPLYVKANVDVYIYYKNKGMIIYNEPEEFTCENSGIIVGKRLANERKYTDMTEHLFALTSIKGVIEPNQFLVCQYRLDGNKQIKNTGKGKLTWLSGLLHCANCGYSLKVMKDRDSGKLRLVCSGRTNYYICDTKHTETIESVEAFVETYINELVKKSKSDTIVHETSTDDNALKLALFQIEEKIGNLVRSLSEGNSITIKYINAELTKLEEEKNSIMRRLSENAVIPSANIISANFSTLSFEGKKEAAQNMLKNVLCSPDNIEVILR